MARHRDVFFWRNIQNKCGLQISLESAVHHSKVHRRYTIYFEHLIAFTCSQMCNKKTVIAPNLCLSSPFHGISVSFKRRKKIITSDVRSYKRHIALWRYVLHTYFACSCQYKILSCYLHLIKASFAENNKANNLFFTWFSDRFFLSVNRKKYSSRITTFLFFL